MSKFDVSNFSMIWNTQILKLVIFADFEQFKVDSHSADFGQVKIDPTC